MPDCSEKLFHTIITDISMVVENVKILGIAEKLYIYSDGRPSSRYSSPEGVL